MAFVPNQQDPNQQNQPSGQGMPGIGMGLAPVSTSSAPGAGPGAPGSASGANQSTGQPFANLSAYLTANAPQIQSQANTISGGLNTQYGNLQNEVNQGVQNFGQQVQSGYTPVNQDMLSQIQTSPVQFASNPTNVQNFQSVLNDQYTGPANFQGTPSYGTINQDVTQGIANANLVNSPSGMQTYFRNNSNANPTAGDTLLDTVLLQGSPDAYKQVQAAAQPFTGLADYLSNQTGIANQGVTAAQQAAAAAPGQAQAALNAPLNTIGQSLQKSLTGAQGAFNTYNTDVGQLQSSAQDINSAIQQYLAANPNIKIAGRNDFLAPWENLQNATTAPTLANIANPSDFANLQALQTLAGPNYSLNMPVDLSQASQAGTFNLPQDLQAAINNQAVPQAMKDELGAISGQITSAFQPFQQAEQAAYNWATYGQPAQTDMVTAQAQLSQLNNSISSMQANPKGVDPATLKGLQDQAAQLQSQIAQDQATIAANPQASWDTISQMAPGLQWLQPAATGYNDLVTRLQGDISGLGNLGIPNYSPSTGGLPPAQKAATDIGKAADLSAVGATGAAGVGSGVMAASEIPGAAGLTGLGPGAGINVGLQSAGQMLGPAALAAYGTSNIAQNAAANPLASGLGTLANTGLSLATLSLPTNVLNSIGKGLTDVVDSIGKFFGNLF